MSFLEGIGFAPTSLVACEGIPATSAQVLSPIKICIYMYIHVYIKNTYVYIYIYTHTHLEREREREREKERKREREREIGRERYRTGFARTSVVACKGISDTSVQVLSPRERERERDRYREIDR